MHTVWALIVMVCPKVANGNHCRVIGDMPHESFSECEFFRTQIGVIVPMLKTDETIVKTCLEIPDRWGFSK